MLNRQKMKIAVNVKRMDYSNSQSRSNGGSPEHTKREYRIDQIFMTALALKKQKGGQKRPAQHPKT
jgi:hypothetical protein